MRKHSSYPALALTQNDQKFYFSTIPVEDLFPCCFVARREEDQIDGFQRVLSESRADDIARYLSVGTGSIPTNVVLSAQQDAEFAYSGRLKTITFKRLPNSFLVLDGQHRLWGYAKCKIKHRVPVAIYDGLTRAEEAKLFIDINTNQRGVPVALLLDIKQLAHMEDTKDSQLRDIFDRLSLDAKSALRGRLSPSKSAPNRISRVTFNRSVASVFESEIARSLLDGDIYKLINNYINAFDAELNDQKLLIRSGYFEAMFEIFDEVLRSTRQAQGNLKQASIQEIIRPVTRLNFEGRGKLTKKDLTRAMQTALRKNISVSADML